MVRSFEPVSSYYQLRALGPLLDRVPRQRGGREEDGERDAGRNGELDEGLCWF